MIRRHFGEFITQSTNAETTPPAATTVQVTAVKLGGETCHTGGNRHLLELDLVFMVLMEMPPSKYSY